MMTEIKLVGFAAFAERMRIPEETVNYYYKQALKKPYYNKRAHGKIYAEAEHKGIYFRTIFGRKFVDLGKTELTQRDYERFIKREHHDA